METTNQYAHNVQETQQPATSITSKAVKCLFKGLFLTGKVAGQTACAIASGAKQGYQEAIKERAKDKAPF